MKTLFKLILILLLSTTSLLAQEIKLPPRQILPGAATTELVTAANGEVTWVRPYILPDTLLSYATGEVAISNGFLYRTTTPQASGPPGANWVLLGLDNLGDHTATTTLNMSSERIINVAKHQGAGDPLTYALVAGLANNEIGAWDASGLELDATGIFVNVGELSLTGLDIQMNGGKLINTVPGTTSGDAIEFGQYTTGVTTRQEATYTGYSGAGNYNYVAPDTRGLGVIVATDDVTSIDLQSPLYTNQRVRVHVTSILGGNGNVDIQYSSFPLIYNAVPGEVVEFLGTGSNWVVLSISKPVTQTELLAADETNKSINSSLPNLAQELGDDAITDNTNIIVVGDSKSNRVHFPGKLQAAYGDQYGYVGNGYLSLSTANNGKLGLIPRSNGANSVPIEYPANTLARYSMDGQAQQLTSTGILEVEPNSNYTTYTSNPEAQYWDYAKITYLRHPAGGSIDIYVDNVFITNLSTSGAEAKLEYEITGLTDGAHTLEIRNVTGTNYTLDGYFLRSNESGPVVSFVANSGWDASDFVTLWNAEANRGLLTDLEPDAVVVRLGTNDSNRDFVPSTFQTNIEDIVDSVLVFNDQADVALLGIEGMSLGTTYTDDEYNDELESLAETRYWEYVSFMEIIPSMTEFQRKGFSDDAIHENPAGSHVTGNFVYNFLNGYIGIGGSSTPAQTLSLNTNDLTISDGNTVDLSTITANAALPEGRIGYGNSSGLLSTGNTNFIYDETNGILGVAVGGLGTIDNTASIQIGRNGYTKSPKLQFHSSTGFDHIFLEGLRGSETIPYFSIEANNTVGGNDDIEDVTVYVGSGASNTKIPALTFENDGNINFETNRAINAEDPVDPQDLATKAYVDANAGVSLWTENAGEIYRETGNVGIGTNDPEVDFHVVDQSANLEARFEADDFSTLRIIADNAGLGTTDPEVRFNIGATQVWRFGVDNSNNDHFMLSSGSLNSSSSVLVAREDVNRIGIGGVLPQRTLHVNGDMRLGTLLAGTPTGILGRNVDGDVVSAGNLAINTLNEVTIEGATGITIPSGNDRFENYTAVSASPPLDAVWTNEGSTTTGYIYIRPPVQLNGGRMDRTSYDMTVVVYGYNSGMTEQVTELKIQGTLHSTNVDERVVSYTSSNPNFTPQVEVYFANRDSSAHFYIGDGTNTFRRASIQVKHFAIHTPQFYNPAYAWIKDGWVVDVRAAKSVHGGTPTGPYNPTALELELNGSEISIINGTAIDLAPVIAANGDGYIGEAGPHNLLDGTFIRAATEPGGSVGRFELATANSAAGNSFNYMRAYGNNSKGFNLSMTVEESSGDATAAQLTVSTETDLSSFSASGVHKWENATKRRGFNWASDQYLLDGSDFLNLPTARPTVDNSVWSQNIDGTGQYLEVGGIIKAIKDSDEVLPAGGSLADDGDLTITGIPVGIYKAEVIINYTGSSINSEIAWNFTTVGVNSTKSGYRFVPEVHNTNNYLSADWTTASLTISDVQTPSSFHMTGVRTGTIEFSSTGTLTLQRRAGATGTLTIYEGSSIILTKIK